MGHNELGYQDVDWIHLLRMRFSCMLLWAQKRTLGFNKLDNVFLASEE
jgi:hypothetical protein